MSNGTVKHFQCNLKCDRACGFGSRSSLLAVTCPCARGAGGPTRRARRRTPRLRRPGAHWPGAGGGTTRGFCALALRLGSVVAKPANRCEKDVTFFWLPYGLCLPFEVSNLLQEDTKASGSVTVAFRGSDGVHVHQVHPLSPLRIPGLGGTQASTWLSPSATFCTCTAAKHPKQSYTCSETP